jgi:UDP-N-acetylmuramoyl-L-alanyl-D-glutamate--2,6-diaminopimelate ligase
MQLSTLIEAIRPAEVAGPAAAPEPGGAPDVTAVTAVTYAAPRARPGCLHACFPGASADGHDFAGEAVRRGAVALLVERPLPLPVPQLVVASARAAMAVAAHEVYGRPSERLAVVGVTGTNGKTTTAFLVRSVLEAAGLRPGLLGTIEAHVGGRVLATVRTTPESPDLQELFRDMLAAGDRSCAMEVSSHALALHRVDAVRFAAAAFTNLTQDHLDFHPTMEDYYVAKRRLFEGDAPPPAAVNADDPYGRRLLAEAPGRTLAYAAEEPSAEVRPRALEIGAGGAISLIADTPRGPLSLDVRLRGGFNVLNVLCAVALGELLDLDHHHVAAGIAAVRGVPGRFEPVDAGQPFTVLVDYAHTPDSLDNVLRAARAITAGRLVCVFGCGGDRDRGKRPLMGAVARRLADRAIVTSDNPRSEDPEAIIAEIAGGVEMETEPDRRAAIERAIGDAAPGDVVVIAGKGHEGGQQFADRTVPFDDREVACEALRAVVT